MIEASFTTQYGIRLRQEPDMSWDEFCTLLSGLSGDTPLGNIVSIRGESNKDILKQFTKEQRRIRSEWQQKQAKEMDKRNVNQVMVNFEAAFEAAFGGGNNGS